MKNLAFWTAAVLLIAGAGAVASSRSDEGRMPELNGAVEWINSAPLNSRNCAGR